MAARPLVAFALVALLTAAAPVADPSGDWLTEDADGVITVAPCGRAICGEISAMRYFQPDGSPPRDAHGLSECHLRIIRDMLPGENGRLNGTITDPRDDSTYQAQLWLSDANTLNLRGYIALPLFGSTRHWTRFKGTRQPNCHFSP